MSESMLKNVKNMLWTNLLLMLVFNHIYSKRGPKILKNLSIKLYRMILKDKPCQYLILFVPLWSGSKCNSRHPVLSWGQCWIRQLQQCRCLLPTVAPVSFVKALHSLELQEGGTAHLSCEVSKPDVPVEWKKGTSVIRSSQKYSIKQEGNVHTLVIHDVNRPDSGEYSCHAADGKTTARLEVKGMTFVFSQQWWEVCVSIFGAL